MLNYYKSTLLNQKCTGWSTYFCIFKISVCYYNFSFALDFNFQKNRLVHQMSLDKHLDTDWVNLTTCLSALGDHLKPNCKQWIIMLGSKLKWQYFVPGTRFFKRTVMSQKGSCKVPTSVSGQQIFPFGVITCNERSDYIQCWQGTCKFFTHTAINKQRDVFPLVERMSLK